MHIIRRLLLLMAICMVHVPLFALDFQSRLLLEAAYVTGKSAYEIDFISGRSRLEWPIDLYLIGLEYTLDIGVFEVGVAYMQGPWKKSSGNLKDSDYIEEAFFLGRAMHPGVDIYSESEVDASGELLGFNLKIFPFALGSVSLGVTGGYMQQRFEFDGSDTIQVGYGPWQDQSCTITGHVIAYEVEYDSWYLGITSRYALHPRISLAGDIVYLAHVRVRDEDDHIRRSKRSDGRCTGDGLSIGLSSRIRIGNDWQADLAFQAMDILARGYQTQTWYGDDPSSSYDDTGLSSPDVDMEIEQKTYQVGLGIGYCF